MSEKTRTWPYSICSHPDDPARFNIRHPAGHVVFLDGFQIHHQARQFQALLNEAFDLGREDRK